MSESYPFEGKPRKNVQLACFLATTTKMRDAVSATTLYQNKSVSLWPSNTDRLLETTGAQEFPDSCTAPHKLLLLRVFPLQATVSASKRSSCGRCKRGSAPQTECGPSQEVYPVKAAADLGDAGQQSVRLAQQNHFHRLVRLHDSNKQRS